jgi:hypothetical protein
MISFQPTSCGICLFGENHSSGSFFVGLLASILIGATSGLGKFRNAETDAWLYRSSTGVVTLAATMLIVLGIYYIGFADRLAQEAIEVHRRDAAGLPLLATVLGLVLMARIGRCSRPE